MDIKNMVTNKAYAGAIPEELQKFHYYIADQGHCIVCVLQCHLDEARENGMDDYEIPVPLKYVLEKGYEVEKGYVILNALYNSVFGVEIPEGYYEY
jgi:hypothetical protein